MGDEDGMYGNASGWIKKSTTVMTHTAKIDTTILNHAQQHWYARCTHAHKNKQTKQPIFNLNVFFWFPILFVFSRHFLYDQIFIFFACAHLKTHFDFVIFLLIFLIVTSEYSFYLILKYKIFYIYQTIIHFHNVIITETGGRSSNGCVLVTVLFTRITLYNIINKLNLKH